MMMNQFFLLNIWHIPPLRTDKNGAIHKYTNDKLGDGVSANKLKSGQTSLVPKFSGKLKNL